MVYDQIYGVVDTLKNAQIINYNSNAPTAKTQKHICSFVQKAEVTSQVPEGNRATKQSCGGGDKESQRGRGAGGRTVRAETERLQSADRTPMTHCSQSR